MLNETDARQLLEATQINWEASVALKDVYMHGADEVWLDLESTAVNFEWWNFAASERGNGAEVVAITNTAMNSGVKFYDAVENRRRLTDPTKETLRKATLTMPTTIEPGLKTFIKTLKQFRKQVRIVSGGFAETAELTQIVLGVPIDANHFAYSIGKPRRIVGVKDDNLLIHSGGKREHIIFHRHNGLGTRRLVMIGDGMSDVETYPNAASLFIGYGGVEKRENVRENTPLYIEDFSVAMVVCLGENNWKAVLDGSDVMAKQMYADGALKIINKQGVQFANDLDWQDLSARLLKIVKGT